MLTNFKGEKPETNVRNLFFRVAFLVSFSNCYGKTTKHSRQKTKNRDQQTKNMLIDPNSRLCCKHTSSTIRSSTVEWTRSLKKGKYNDLTDGRYEKIIYVKTWKGKTITVKINLNTVENVKGQIE